MYLSYSLCDIDHFRIPRSLISLDMCLMLEAYCRVNRRTINGHEFIYRKHLVIAVVGKVTDTCLTREFTITLSISEIALTSEDEQEGN